MAPNVKPSHTALGLRGCTAWACIAWCIACGADDGQQPQEVCTDCGACEQALDVTSAKHVVGAVDYAEHPPAGGDHNECWGAWGVHDAPLAPERWVHNLEHGGVVFLYDCPSGCSADVAKLEELVAGRPLALLTAYPDISTRFAVVAWGRRLTSECLDLQAFQAFYDAHVGQAPESVPDDPPVGCPL